MDMAVAKDKKLIYTTVLPNTAKALWWAEPTTTPYKALLSFKTYLRRSANS
jgi:hypothetical protein